MATVAEPAAAVGIAAVVVGGAADAGMALPGRLDPLVAAAQGPVEGTDHTSRRHTD